MELTLECQVRSADTKGTALRRLGQIPVALYGHDGSNSTLLTAPAKEVEMLLRDVIPNKTVVQLVVPEISWRGPVVLREAQTHPAKPILYHLSFFADPALASAN